MTESSQPTVTAQDFLSHLAGVARSSGIKSARLKPLKGVQKFRTGKHAGGKTQKGVKGKNWRTQAILAHNAEIKRVDEAAKRVIQEQESGRITQMMKDAAIAFQNLPQPTPVTKCPEFRYLSPTTDRKDVKITNTKSLSWLDRSSATDDFGGGFHGHKGIGDYSPDDNAQAALDRKLETLPEKTDGFYYIYIHCWSDYGHHYSMDGLIYDLPQPTPVDQIEDDHDPKWEEIMDAPLPLEPAILSDKFHDACMAVGIPITETPTTNQEDQDQ